MKKQFNLFILFTSIISFSQVGINTENPQGIFNIDGKKDNPVTNAPSQLQQLNDFTVTTEGKVGIGTTEPSQSLDIATGGTIVNPITGFKLADGNQYEGYILTSNKDGIGTWKSSGITVIYGKIGSYKKEQDATVKTANYWTGSSISLPPGKWLVYSFMIINFGNYDKQVSIPPNNGAWIRSTFSESLSEFKKTEDFEGSNLISGLITGPSNYSILSGAVMINNKSKSIKTYYYWRDSSEIYDYTGPNTIYNDSSNTVISTNPYKNENFKNSKFTEAKLVGFGQDKWGENIIYAYPVINK